MPTSDKLLHIGEQGPREHAGQEPIASVGALSLFTNYLQTHLFCTVKELASSPPLRDCLAKALDAARVQVDGEKAQDLESFARSLEENPHPMERALVLCSSSLAHGEDAPVEWLVDLQGDTGDPLTPPPDADIDIRCVTKWVNVDEGSPLCRFGAATPGTSGVDIFGEYVEAKDGNSTPIEAGDGCRLVGQEIVASLAGAVRLEGATIVVDALLTIKGDLDYSIGNIDFAGSVRIGGCVSKGFVVRSRGDLEVGGSVSGARLEVGGNVVVKQGVKGGSTLRVLGELSTTYIHDSDVRVESTVTVRAEILRSVVRSGGDILISRGSIIGENVSAAGMVEASILGSADEPSTLVIAGASPQFSDMILYSHYEQREIDEQIASLESKLGDKLDDEVRNSLRGPPRSHYRGLYKKREKLLVARTDLLKELFALAEETEEAPRSAPCVRVQRTIYRQVKVQIGANPPTEFLQTTTGSRVIEAPTSSEVEEE